MANQLNFVENISDTSRGQVIWRFPEPTSALISELTKDSKIGLDTTRENIEIHFYDINTNEFITSVRIPLDENYLYIREAPSTNSIEFGLEIWNANDPDNSLMTKYFSDILPGYYNIVVYFFAEELGSLDNINWKIKTISTSRTELLIESNTENPQNIEQFADSSMFFDDFSDLVYYTFNKSSIPLGMESEVLDINNFTDFYSIVEQFTTEGSVYLRQIKDDAYRSKYQDALQILYTKIFNRIVEYLFNERKNKRFRITRTSFSSTLQNIVSEEVQNNILLFPEGNIVTRAE